MDFLITVAVGFVGFVIGMIVTRNIYRDQRETYEKVLSDKNKYINDLISGFEKEDKKFCIKYNELVKSYNQLAVWYGKAYKYCKNLESELIRGEEGEEWKN
jgi:hypothetical protein